MPAKDWAARRIVSLRDIPVSAWCHSLKLTCKLVDIKLPTDTAKPNVLSG
ncbi:GSCOCG00006000001-RA-CDS [Cotesia congregata]|nr:GSCOCG00006000001-RA-CDS [Cotesia congregata]